MGGRARGNVSFGTRHKKEINTVNWGPQGNDAKRGAASWPTDRDNGGAQIPYDQVLVGHGWLSCCLYDSTASSVGEVSTFKPCGSCFVRHSGPHSAQGEKKVLVRC